jgi:hypothetical protein
MGEPFGQSTVIDIPTILQGISEPWTNVDLTQVNDAIVRLGVFEGEFHWHKHDEEDELFLVLEGRMLLDLQGETLELGPWEGYTCDGGEGGCGPPGRLSPTSIPNKT